MISVTAKTDNRIWRKKKVMNASYYFGGMVQASQSKAVEC